jgi:hypothetical protein
MAAFERRCAAAGITENVWELDETSGDHLGAFYRALERLLRTPAPDVPALAMKIKLAVDHEIGSLIDNERCLAALKADARRLASGA